MNIKIYRTDKHGEIDIIIGEKIVCQWGRGILTHFLTGFYILK